MVESLLPADRAPTALRDSVTGMAIGEPGWLATINTAAGRVLGSHGLAFSIMLAVVFGLLAVSVFLPRTPARVILLVGVAVALVIWLVAQDLGGIATGQATDPNSGLLLVLLILCFWPLQARHRPLQQPARRRPSPGVSAAPHLGARLVSTLGE